MADSALSKCKCLTTKHKTPISIQGHVSLSVNSWGPSSALGFKQLFSSLGSDWIYPELSISFGDSWMQELVNNSQSDRLQAACFPPPSCPTASLTERRERVPYFSPLGWEHLLSHPWGLLIFPLWRASTDSCPFLFQKAMSPSAPILIAKLNCYEGSEMLPTCQRIPFPGRRRKTPCGTAGSMNFTFPCSSPMGTSWRQAWVDALPTVGLCHS